MAQEFFAFIYPGRNKMHLLALLCLPYLISCAASQVATLDDYDKSTTAFRMGHFYEAIDELPKIEDGGFIHTFEASWMRFLARNPHPAELVQITEHLEERKTFRASSELKTLFYMEADDHYFPGEHEVIFAHIINAYSFAVTGDAKGARVEIKRASRYLQGHFNERAGDFDDPALRVMIGSLWAYLGEWNEARIDFKHASRMLPDNLSLKHLATRTSPPKNLILALSGVGHQAQWIPKSSPGVISGLKHIDFVPEEDPTSITVIFNEGEQRKDISEMIATTPWYERHQERNQAIKDILENSQYFFDASGGSIVGGTIASTSIILGASVVALGVLGAYYASTVSYSGELAATSLGLGLYGCMSIADSGFHASKKVLDQTVNPTQYYRFVRFLPEHVYFDYNNKETHDFQISRLNNYFRPKYILSTAKPDRGSNIIFFYLEHKAPSKNYWVDTAEKKAWLLGRRQIQPSHKPLDCGELNELLRGKLCRYLTVEELRKALADGLIGKSPLPFAFEFVKDSRIWVTPGDKNDCVYYDTKQAKEILSPSCSEEGILSLYITED